MAEHSHISICICTFKRAAQLGRLLQRLDDLITEDRFEYSAVVVDNDADGSAEATMLDWAQRSRVVVSYYLEPEQNISLARNRAVGEAKGDYLAFIDDDELPDRVAVTDVLDLDISLGMILKKLDELRIADRTYVVYTADHGTPGAGNQPLRDGKGTVWEGGIRVPEAYRRARCEISSHLHAYRSRSWTVASSAKNSSTCCRNTAKSKSSSQG